MQQIIFRKFFELILLIFHDFLNDFYSNVYSIYILIFNFS